MEDQNENVPMEETPNEGVKVPAGAKMPGVNVETGEKVAEEGDAPAGILREEQAAPAEETVTVEETQDEDTNENAEGNTENE